MIWKSKYINKNTKINMKKKEFVVFFQSMATEKEEKISLGLKL